MERLNKYNRFTIFNDLELSEKKQFLSEIMTIAAEFKDINITDNQLAVAAKHILDFLYKKYRHFTIANIITALEQGMCSEYDKKYSKVNADLIVYWLNSYHNESVSKVYVNNVQVKFQDGSQHSQQVLAEGRIYGQAVVLRRQYDPDYVKTDKNNITLDMIVEEIKKGKNIFTGGKYEYEKQDPNWISNIHRQERMNAVKKIGDII